jgi:hypothetical protein
MSGATLGIIEMALSAVLVLGFIAWQLWTVRDVWWKRPSGGTPEETRSAPPRHPERDHEPRR